MTSAQVKEEPEIPSYEDKPEFYDSVAEELHSLTYDNLDRDEQKQVDELVAREAILGEPGSLEDMTTLHAHSHDN